MYREQFYQPTELGVKLMSIHAQLPRYANPGDSGFDIASSEYKIIPPRGFGKVQTGLAFNIPADYELQVRPRSGLASRGIQAHFGTVDCGYTGEVAVIIYNHTTEDFVVMPGDRIAQGVLVGGVYQAKLTEAVTLKESERGADGFGSSGIKSV